MSEPGTGRRRGVDWSKGDNPSAYTPLYEQSAEFFRRRAAATMSSRSKGK